MRITHRGAAAHRGLFDEVVVPAGHRFTFELTVRDDTEAIIEGLVGLLASPAVRLGGKTRRGLGAFRVIRANRRRFDLTKRGDHEALGALDPDLSTPPAQFSRLTPKPPRPTGGRAPLVATMKLKPRGLWLIGGGDGETDHAPYTEPRVVWEGGAARWEAARLAVPATALKGALRHRAAFRWNLAHEKYADQLADPAEVAAHGGTDNPGLIALFGDVGSGSERARAGRLYVEDATVSGNWREGRQDHVSLDRFTGGAFPGRLFDETLVHGGELSSQLVIRPPVDPSDQFRDAVAALNSALSDLSRRGIQLGAGHGRGHGWMETTVDRDAAWTAFLEEST